MKQTLAISFLIFTFVAFLSVPAAAASIAYTTAPEHNLLITEFQTNGGTAAQEFIEIFNNTDHDIDFDDTTTGQTYRLQFLNSMSVKSGLVNWSATASPSNSILLTGKIKARSYYTIASTNYEPAGAAASVHYSPSGSHLMTDSGGGLQIVLSNGSSSQLSYDRIAWLAPSNGFELPPGLLPSPFSGKSLQRLPFEDGAYEDSRLELAGFIADDGITPGSKWLPPPVSNEDDPVDQNLDDNHVLINELLPNPASPLTDAKDEFIELYNSSLESADISGYRLEAGISSVRSYNFPAGTVLEPHEYRAFFVTETLLTLSNTGSVVALKNTSNVTISQTDKYGAAAENSAWIPETGSWIWSLTATPGEMNISLPPLVSTAAKASSVKKPASKSAATVKKSTVAKTAKKATTKSKVVKTKKTKKAAVKTIAAITPEKPKPPIHTGILVAVVIAAVLYGLYEYRHDISARCQRLIRHDRSRRQDRPAASGWGTDQSDQ